VRLSKELKSVDHPRDHKVIDVGMFGCGREPRGDRGLGAGPLAQRFGHGDG
jgi:hypothetical protein